MARMVEGGVESEHRTERAQDGRGNTKARTTLAPKRSNCLMGVTAASTEDSVALLNS